MGLGKTIRAAYGCGYTARGSVHQLMNKSPSSMKNGTSLFFGTWTRQWTRKGCRAKAFRAKGAKGVQDSRSDVGASGETMESRNG